MIEKRTPATRPEPTPSEIARLAANFLFCGAVPTYAAAEALAKQKLCQKVDGGGKRRPPPPRKVHEKENALTQAKQLDMLGDQRDRK